MNLLDRSAIVSIMAGFYFTMEKKLGLCSNFLILTMGDRWAEKVGSVKLMDGV